MPTRRQEKVARMVMRAVSEAISQDLSDPRIQGLISVTRVEMSPDLRNAEVYFSIYAETDTVAQTTFTALQHARSHVQQHVGDVVRTKFCPILHFQLDEQFKKTLEVFNLIDEAASEYHAEEAEQTDAEETPANESRDDL